MRLPSALIMISLVVTGLLQGCANPRIPNKVSDREYEIYAAWTNHKFAGKASKALFIYSRTACFDPLAPYEHGDVLHRKDGVSWNMMEQLHSLGEAEYPLDLYSGHHEFHVASSFHEIDSPPNDSTGSYNAISFSRIAFNRAGDEALFAVSVTCAASECGSGGPVLARKAGGRWTFESTHEHWFF